MLINLILDTLKDIVFVTILFLLSFGIGGYVWSHLFKESKNSVGIIEEGLFGVSIGMGILSIIVLIIGLFGILYFWTIFLIFIAILIFAFHRIRDYLIIIYRNMKSILLPILINHSKYSLILGSVLIVFFIFILFLSRIPPIFYDALVYHLGVPNQYIVRHAIRFNPYSFHSHHPFLIQNIFLICLLFGGIKTPKLVNLSFALLICITVSLFAIKLSKRRFSLISGIILFLTPTILIMSLLVNVDIGFSLYSLLAFYALFFWINSYKENDNLANETLIPAPFSQNSLKNSSANQISINDDEFPGKTQHSLRNKGLKGFYNQVCKVYKRDPCGISEEMITKTTDNLQQNNTALRTLSLEKKTDNWLILSAIMTGLALGTKYTAIIYSLSINLICILIFLALKQRDIKNVVKKGLIFLLISVLIGSCWFIKNIVWTKNPFYPTWANVWGEPRIPEKNMKLFSESAHAYEPADSLKDNILTLPIKLITSPEDFGAGGNVGFLFFILLPLALIPYQKNPIHYFMIIYCLLYLIFWAFSFRMTRFAIPFIAVVIILSTLTLGRIFTKKRNWARYFIILILTFGFLYNIYYSTSLFGKIYNPWRYLIGIESERVFLSKNVKAYPVFDFINNNLSEESAILFIGETINFYCNRRAIVPTAFDTNPIIKALKTRNNKEGVKKYLKGMGITHILINFNEMNRLEDSYGAFQLNEQEKRVFYSLLDELDILYNRDKVFLILL